MGMAIAAIAVENDKDKDRDRDRDKDKDKDNDRSMIAPLSIWYLCRILHLTVAIAIACGSDSGWQVSGLQSFHPIHLFGAFGRSIRKNNSRIPNVVPEKTVHDFLFTSNIDPIESPTNESMAVFQDLKREGIKSKRPPIKSDFIVDRTTSMKPSLLPLQPKRLSTQCIRSKRVGSLKSSDMQSLCNGIRYGRNESALRNLETLQRLLLEFKFVESNGFEIKSEKRRVYLTRNHVFTLLTVLSNDVRSWGRHRHIRKEYEKLLDSGSTILVKSDVQHLVNVVNLLSDLRNSFFIDSDCFNKDVLSFATMIAAEMSKYEESAIDAALCFLDMIELEDVNVNKEWDPRIIGATLDGLARYGRAEEAQVLLGRAIGLKWSRINNTDASVVVSRKRLATQLAGPCYDALIRSWSRRALLLSQVPSCENSTRVEDALARARHILLHDMPDLDIAVTNKTISTILHGYSALGMGSACESLLMEIETSPLMSPSLDSVKPSVLDVGCYNNLLRSDNVICVERVFTAMHQQQPLSMSIMRIDVSKCNRGEPLPQLTIQNVIPPKPDFNSYLSMINCYCKHDMVADAEKLLGKMYDSPFKPNKACYLPILQGLERSQEPDAPHRAFTLIERPIRKPSRIVYLTALKCAKRHGCGEEAENIFEKYRNSFPDRAVKDLSAHMLVLRAWEKTISKSDRLTASRRAQQWFYVMQTRVNESSLPALDVSAFNCLLNCHARAGEAEKAMELLSKMESLLQPTSKSYSLVIKAWSNSDAADAVHQGWKIVKHFDNFISSPGRIKIYNSMLRLFAKRGMASEAEALLNTMDAIIDGSGKNNWPDIQSYEAVLEALGRCGDVDAPYRAEALVTRLEVLSELGGCFQPSLLAYNSLLNCYANAGMAGKAERVLEGLNDADSYSIGSTLKAIVNSGKSQVVSLARAKSLINAHGLGNQVMFTHRLKLCQKWGLGKEAEQLLHQMKEQRVQPNIIHHTAAINAWATSVDNDALKRAELLFKITEEQFELDRAAFHSLMLNYSMRGKSRQAEHLLQRMQKHRALTPNRASFTMVIDAYARSKSSDAGQKAEDLLDQMRQLHAAGNEEVEPDRITYASVIKCKLLSPTERNIRDLSKLDKLHLMEELQIESWPF